MLLIQIGNLASLRRRRSLRLARNTPQGQWLDDIAAEDFIARHLDQLGQGIRDIQIPSSINSIGRVFKTGDGQILPVTHIRLKPSGSGVETAFPINETLVDLHPLGVYKP